MDLTTVMRLRERQRGRKIDRTKNNLALTGTKDRMNRRKRDTSREEKKVA